MKTSVLTSVLATSLLVLPLGGAEPGSSGMQLHPTDKIEWKPGPPSLPKGAQIAVLEGDPAKEGPFVFRLKVPDGYRVPPHTHPKIERVTVIAGRSTSAWAKNSIKAPRSQCSRAPTVFGKRA